MKDIKDLNIAYGYINTPKKVERKVITINDIIELFKKDYMPDNFVDIDGYEVETIEDGYKLILKNKVEDLYLELEFSLWGVDQLQIQFWESY